MRDSSVRAKEIDRAEAVLRLGDEVADRTLGRYVRRPSEGSDLGSRHLECGGIDIGCNNRLCPVTNKAVSKSPANAARRTRDHDDLTRYSHEDLLWGDLPPIRFSLGARPDTACRHSALAYSVG